MQIAIFIFYLLLCSWLVMTIPFFKNSGLHKKWLLSLFFIKILAGFAYAQFYKLPKYYAGADTWRFHRLSLAETHLLLKSPIAFIQDLFTHGYAKTGNLFSGENTYWNDLKSNVIVKLMAVMNVLTNNSYYTSIILFNLLFFFGLIGLFRLFNSIYPTKKLLIILSIFLLPSTLFWCSGIHKDGLILSAVGMIIYLIHIGLVTKRLKPFRLLAMLLLLVLIFFLRNYVALALLPPLLCWWLAYKHPTKARWIFILTYTIGIALFFLLPKFVPALNLAAFVVEKQHEFLQLEGGSAINLPPLTPTLSSFINFFPYAIDMAFLRPHLTEAKSLSHLPAALELVVLLLVFLAFLVTGKKLNHHQPIIWFCIFFSLSILMLSGYTITFSGAIVRYRSFILPLLITPFICLISIKSARFKLYYNKI